jgi:hypothetical protein
MSGQFDGQATFAGSAIALTYREAGLFRIGAGPALVAERSYQWAFDAGQVTVTFADGRPFHSFTPGVTGPGTDHPCGDDLYRVAYEWSGWPEWTATWDVTGPRKDYRLVSHYRRSA